MHLEQVKQIYRCAIDPTANDGESDTWWSEVSEEVQRVIAAPDAHAGAAVIAQWHQDWSLISDSPLAASRRIRKAAQEIKKPPKFRGICIEEGR